MKISLCVFLLLSWVKLLSAETPDVSSELIKTLAGESTIHLSFITTASPDKIWSALTVTDELTKWAAPEVHVDFRVGGDYEYFFNPHRPEGRRGMEGTKILCYVPGKILSHTNSLPYTWVVWTIEPAGDQQAVHYYAVGNTPDWNETCAARAPQALELMERLAKYVQP